MRNGKWVKAPSKALVLGDIINFSSGDRIEGDVRLSDSSSLYIELSALTYVRTCTKDGNFTNSYLQLGIKNMAFMGIMITEDLYRKSL